MLHYPKGKMYAYILQCILVYSYTGKIKYSFWSEKYLQYAISIKIWMLYYCITLQYTSKHSSSFKHVFADKIVYIIHL